MVSYWLAWMVSAVGPPVPSAGVHCEVEVVGMPVSVIRHHRLWVGTRARPLEPRMTIELPEQRTLVRVAGLRYRGERWLKADDCAQEGSLTLPVEPLPARVVFPCPPPGLTVTCTRCPGFAEDQVFLPEHFPTIEMDSFSQEIELLLRAPGFRRRTQPVSLHPGPNTLRVELDPH